MALGLADRSGDAEINWGALEHPERAVLATFADLVGDVQPHHLPTGDLEVAAAMAFPRLDVFATFRVGDMTLVGPDLQYAMIGVLRDEGLERTAEILRGIGRLADGATDHEDPDALAGALVDRGVTVDEDLRVRARLFCGLIAGVLLGIRPEEV